MRTPGASGRIIYLAGASGSGKDSLMRYARERLAGCEGVVFAHRYITRPPEAGGENHVALSAAEFDARRRAGLLALHWESHGNAYGIGIEIDGWLAAGMTVVVNGSRAYADEARRRYPGLVPVHIEVSPELLHSRLCARGREDAAAIAARLQRHCALAGERDGRRRDGITLCNDGFLAEAGDALVGVILEHTRMASCA